MAMKQIRRWKNDTGWYGPISRATRDEGVLDFVITSVMIIDHWGIVKADIGIKDGKIVGIGKAGNPDTMDGVQPNMVIGASTEVHGGAGFIATAGGIDTHIHFICPQQIDHALFSGITTMIGGGTGPQMEPMQQRLPRVHGIFRKCSKLRMHFQ